MAKIYPNDKDILLEELFNFQKYFKDCFSEEVKKDSIRILNGILKLDNIGQQNGNEINNMINICLKTNK